MQSNTSAHDQIESVGWAPSAQPDHYSILVNAIARATSDPARLRKLVYALALQNFKPGSAGGDPVQAPLDQATTLIELEQALALENAIALIEHQATEAERTAAAEEAEVAEDAAGADPDGALILPESDPDSASERLPTFLDQAAGPSAEPAKYAPVRRRSALRTGLFSVTQIALASVFGAALYAGLAGWLELKRQAMDRPFAAPQAAPPIRTAAAVRRPETVGLAHPDVRQPGTALPFPLPQAAGVYADNDGRLAALERLPIDLPTGRFWVSAEINAPGHTLVSADNLRFVLFKQSLGDNAPAAVTVRVVARVTRAMTFVNGQPAVTPVAAAWRVRHKSYEFKVVPVDGHPGLLVVEPNPGLTLPPGRYALVLNSDAYDFIVPGPVTAPEQCLEQFQVQNGTMLSECPKS